MTQSFKYSAAALWVAAILVMGLIATAWVTLRQAAANQAQARAAITERTAGFAGDVIAMMQLYQYGLRGARGAVLTAGDDRFTRALFHQFSATWDLATEFPGSTGFGFARRVRQEDEARFVQQARDDGWLDFAIRTLAPHDGDRYIVQYMEPIAGNEPVIGLDMASEANRRAAVMAATREATIAMSGPIILVNLPANDQTTFLLALPIYRGGETPVTVPEREAAVLGWSTMALRMSDMLAHVPLDTDAFHVRVFDVTVPNSPNLFFQTHAATADTPEVLSQSVERDIYGRRWRIELGAHPLFVQRLNQLQPRFVALVGMLATLLSAVLAGALSIARQRKALVVTEQARLATIVENSSDAVIGQSLDGTIMSWNRAAERLFGYSEADVLGKPLADLLVPPDRRQEDTELLLRIKGGEVTESFDTIRLHRNGTPLEVAMTAGTVRDANGRILGAAKLLRDIRTRKEEERRHRAAAEHATASALGLVLLRDRALEAITQGITITDDKAPGTPIIYTNPAFAALTRYSSEEIIGRSPLSFYDDDVAPGIIDRMRRAKSEKRPWRMEMEFKRKDSSRFLDSTATSLIIDQDGEIGYSVTVHEDVTEIRKREELLLEAQKMESVGQLTGGIAHDFNNLLTAVKSNAEDLKEDLKDKPFSRKQADIILQAADRGAGLVAQLMAFARKQELQPKTVDVNALLDSFLKLVRSTLPANIKIELRAMAEAPLVHVDPGRLESALLNLVLNARDAMPEGGTITIETLNKLIDADYMSENLDVNPGAYVLIAVTDTGTGMPQNVVERAFTPFFTTKEVGKGTGLGLSMVHGFVKQSGGHAKIYSEIGLGTVIKIYLPALGQPTGTVNPAERAAPSVTGGSGGILLVEDDALVRESIGNKLTALGYQVMTADTALSALEILKRSPHFDLVFTDVIMPGPMNGADLVREIQRRWPQMKILMTSGYTESTVLGKVKLPPNVALLSKPYSNAELALHIRETIGPLKAS